MVAFQRLKKKGNLMKNGEIYLDNNASSRPLPEVLKRVAEVLEFAGNASSPHSFGKKIRDIIEDSRNKFAAFVGADPEGTVFTSSGTEANNMALACAVNSGRKKTRIVTTSVEHSSVKKMCSHLEIKGAEIARVGVYADGLADMEELEKQISTGADIVSVQWVNNETGVIQDIERVAEMCRKNGALLHTDAAQAPGKIPVDINALGADFATFTGHKFNALQGCGAIFAKDKLALNQLLFGGFQEGGFRPGTENVAGIAGIGKAAETRSRNLEQTAVRLAEMRDFFEEEILRAVPQTSVNGNTGKRAPNTTNIMFGGKNGAEMTAVLDSLGLKCSQSSACTSFETAPSYVLTAMGLSDAAANSSIRFSFGTDNSMEETQEAVKTVIKAHGKCS